MARSQDTYGNGAREHSCGLDRLTGAGASGSFLVVAAHPDDETIGVGATLGVLAARGAHVRVLHVTDGAPRDATLRPALRDLSPPQAAVARRGELERALVAGGLDAGAVLAPSLGFVDQEAPLALVAIAHAVARHLGESSPDVVITHPYEGGHPDHDAVAFAVHAAVRLLSIAPIGLVEMTSYHAPRTGTAMETATFLEAPAGLPCSAHHDGRLDAGARARKRAMLDAFASQVEVLRAFACEAEPLRCAPVYDFTRPPHPGTLHYERLPFGWTGERWRALAAEALAELGAVSPSQS